MPAIAFDRFYRYAELTTILHALTAEHPDLSITTPCSYQRPRTR